MSETTPRPRKRMGCLSSLVLLLLLGVFLTAAIDAAFAPWIYVVGGRLRLLPLWQGVGDAQTPSGRYRFYVWFSPSPNGSSILPSTSIRGSGYLCTPRGERFRLRVTGGTGGRVWRDMDGRDFHLSAYHRPVGWQFSGSQNWQPRLSLSGRWVGPDLVMNDQGSLAHAFLPDGTLNTKATSWYSKTDPGIAVTLTERAWWWGGNVDCPKPGN
jgi:hypothetical protein